MPANIDITFCATCPGHPRRCETDSTIDGNSTNDDVKAALATVVNSVADQVEADGCADLADKLRLAVA